MEPKRTVGMAKLAQFMPRVVDYAAKRNFDLPGHPHVSQLSPYVSCRLLTEQEIIEPLLGIYSFSRIEKFVQEVCWRTYWKGWLEMRPQVWREYRRSLATISVDKEQLKTAQEARTGIECFDSWCTELIETGYLHNHARMWFASIWIFTLKLPWQLGADFFFRHLLDGDAASNTLSWRWVAGLQTIGKAYVAQADNIRKFTAGRFHPSGKLNEQLPVLPTDISFPKPDADSFSDLPTKLPTEAEPRCGLLILGDDLCPENSPLAGARHFDSIAAGWDESLQKEYVFSPKVLEFKRGAIADSLSRSSKYWSLPKSAVVHLREDQWLDSVLEWCNDRGLKKILCLHPSVGPWRETLDRLKKRISFGESNAVDGGFDVQQCEIREVLRAWDAAFWPHATKGFFPFRQKIPHILESIQPSLSRL